MVLEDKQSVRSREWIIYGLECAYVCVDMSVLFPANLPYETKCVR